MNRILKYLRIVHDYSISGLAQKFGVSHTYISKVENGDKEPSEKLLELYCKEFHLSKKALAYFEETDNHRKLNNQEVILMILQEICKRKEKL